jgi:hypothetical protein
MRMARFIAPVVALALGQNLAQAQPSLPEPPGAIEFRSVSEALEALRAKPGVSVTVTKPDGWIIANEGQSVFWSFTPQGHYAYPAVIRREIIMREGNIYVEMRALCQAEKELCDRLLREFQDLNERMRLGIQQRIGAKR